MNPEQQHIAIAESMGLKKIGSPNKLMFGARAPEGYYYFAHQLSSYTTDLNAMHEVISEGLGRGGGGWAKYLENLRKVCKIPHGLVCLALVEATAAQRAEAYLKTLNLWKP